MMVHVDRCATILGQHGHGDKSRTVDAHPRFDGRRNQAAGDARAIGGPGGIRHGCRACGCRGVGGCRSHAGHLPWQHRRRTDRPVGMLVQDAGVGAGGRGGHHDRSGRGEHGEVQSVCHRCVSSVRAVGILRTGPTPPSSGRRGDTLQANSESTAVAFPSPPHLPRSASAPGARDCLVRPASVPSRPDPGHAAR